MLLAIFSTLALELLGSWSFPIASSEAECPDGWVVSHCEVQIGLQIDSEGCEVGAVCTIKKDSEESKITVCPKINIVDDQTIEILGDMSSTMDDAQSIAICPDGYVVSYCEVETGLVHSESDGAHVGPNDARVCVAFNGGSGSGVVARALCSRNANVTNPCNTKGPDIPKFVNLHSKSSDPSLFCPPSYQQILCNARSPWKGLLEDKGVSTNGVIPNNQSCAVFGCSDNNWCEVTAVCSTTAVCAEEVEIFGERSSTADDAQSVAICPDGYVVSYCEVLTGLVHYQSDGAYVDPSDGSVCVAFNGAFGPGAIAYAICSRNEQISNPCDSEGPDIPKFINLYSKGTDPSLSCELGYEQILCNARSPWYNNSLTDKNVDEKGVINNFFPCSISGCDSYKYCEVSSVCQMLDSEKYKFAVCPSV